MRRYAVCVAVSASRAGVPEVICAEYLIVVVPSSEMPDTFIVAPVEDPGWVYVAVAGVLVATVAWMKAIDVRATGGVTVATMVGLTVADVHGLAVATLLGVQPLPLIVRV